MSKLISKPIIYNSIIKAKCGKKIRKGEDGYQTSADILNQKFNDIQNRTMRNIYTAGLFRRPSSTSTEETSKSKSTIENPTTTQTPVAQTPASQTEPAPFTMKAPQYNKPKISFWDKLFGRAGLKEQNARVQFDQANQNYLNAYRKWGDDLTNYYTNKARTMAASISKDIDDAVAIRRKENEALNSDQAKTFWGQRAVKAGLLSEQEVRDWQAKHDGLVVDGKFGRKSMEAWNKEHEDQPSLQFTEEGMKAATFVPRTTYPRSSNRGTRNKGGNKPVTPADPSKPTGYDRGFSKFGNIALSRDMKIGQTWNTKAGYKVTRIDSDTYKIVSPSGDYDHIYKATPTPLSDMQRDKTLVGNTRGTWNDIARRVLTQKEIESGKAFSARLSRLKKNQRIQINGITYGRGWDGRLYMQKPGKPQQRI